MNLSDIERQHARNYSFQSRVTNYNIANRSECINVRNIPRCVTHLLRVIVKECHCLAVSRRIICLTKHRNRSVSTSIQFNHTYHTYTVCHNVQNVPRLGVYHVIYNPRAYLSRPLPFTRGRVISVRQVALVFPIDMCAGARYASRPFLWPWCVSGGWIALQADSCCTCLVLR